MDSSAQHQYVEKNNELFNKYIAQINERDRSATENFEKHLLTLSTSALGFSIMFAKQNGTTDQLLLFFSWAFLCATIFLTLFSYYALQAGLNWFVAKCEPYFTDPISNPYPKIEENPFHAILKWLNIGASVCFAIGILLTTIYVGSSL